MYKGNISLGAVFLISNLINGAILLIAMESIITYGVFSGLGLALASGVACFLAFPIIMKVRKEISGEKDLFSFLRKKLSPEGFFILSLFSLLNSAAIMLFQLLTASLLFNAILNTQFPVGQTIIFGIGLFLRGFWKEKQLSRLAIFQLAWVFAVALLLPLYLFMREGVDTIYTGVRLYHPYLFFLKDPRAYYFTLTYVLVSLTSNLLNNKFWQQALDLEVKKSLPAFVFAGLIGSTLPLAYSSLIFDVLYKGGFKNLATILSDLLSQISSPIFIFLFVFSIAISVLYTYLVQIDSLTSFLKEWRKEKGGKTLSKKKFKKIDLEKYFGIPNIITTGVYLLSIILHVSILQMVLILGIISTSTIIPLIFIIYFPGKINKLCPFPMLVGAVLGIAAFLHWGIFTGVAASFIVTGILCLVMLKVSPQSGVLSNSVPFVDK